MAPPGRRHPRRLGDDLLKRVAVIWLIGAALVAAVAGCGGKEKAQQTTTASPTKTTAVRVYFLRAGKVQPVMRKVTLATPPESRERFALGLSLEQLLRGPTPSEQRSLGLSSQVEGPLDMTTSNGIAHLEGDVRDPVRAQIVYTLTQFPSVKAVEFGNKRYTRGDFEVETPIILVESPLPNQTVKSPLHATGTANTFEATFQYDLVGPDGKLLKTHFVTATSGSGTRGTFDFTVPFTVARAGDGKLIVYERSAEDGSRIHEIEIPIRLTP